MSNIVISVSNDNTVMKEFSEKSGETMTDLMTALGSLKTLTNEYLTELVEASKPAGRLEARKKKIRVKDSVSGNNRAFPRSGCVQGAAVQCQ